MDQSPYHPPPSADRWTALARRRLFSRALLSVDVQLSPNIRVHNDSSTFTPSPTPLILAGCHSEAVAVGRRTYVAENKHTLVVLYIYIYYVTYIHTYIGTVDAFLLTHHSIPSSQLTSYNVRLQSRFKFLTFYVFIKTPIRSTMFS